MTSSLKHLTKCILATAGLLCISFHAYGQSVLRGTVIDSSTGDGVPGARIRLMVVDSLVRGTLSNADGAFQLSNIHEGPYRLLVTSSGYEGVERALMVEKDSLTVTVLLHPRALVGQEVVVSGTRTERSIEDVPVRVESVSQEDIEEKIMEKPSSVIELLNESVGTRIQSTSATGSAANIRIQGLDGRYTQVLVDGIPSYTGLASNLGLTQLMPLNLRRVEIVKGASSALYGPDAIAGLINFITKDPDQTPEASAVLNVTNQQGFDAAGYYGKMFGALGVSALAAYSKQNMFDVNGDGFSDIAGQERFEFSPKFKYNISDNVTGVTTATFLKERRLGGVMSATDADVGKGAPWVESDKSTQYDLSTSLAWKINDRRSLSVRGAAVHLTRDSYFGPRPFNGTQNFRFADAQYQYLIGKHSLLIGTSYQQDAFVDRTPAIGTSRSYSYPDLGGWIEDDMQLSSKWEALGVARIDRNEPFGTFFTPRASIMFRPSPMLSMRLGAGTGFKDPTIFLEDAELYGYANLRALSNVAVEQARSASFDINYHAPIGELAAKFDLAIFLTDLEHALLLNEDSLTSNILFIQNATGPTVSRGIETTADVSLDELRLTVSYAYLDVQQTNEARTYPLELNPKHWIGMSLTYEDEEEGWKGGIEAYYISPQTVDRDPFRSMTPSYWNTGMLIEKAFGIFHFYLNSENIFDVRQSKYEPAYLGDPMSGAYHPLPIWAPIEGRTINGGIRIAWH